MRRFAVFALAATIAACGLGVVGIGVDDLAAPGTDGGNVVDGATLSGDEAGPAGSDGGVVTDGGVETGAPPQDAGDGGKPNNSCVTIVDQMLATPDAKWHLAGSAEKKNGRIELTDKGAMNDRGAMWWTDSITWAKELDVVITYTTDDPANPGAGLAIAWVTTNPGDAVGDQGPNYGICNATPGLTGVAAGLRLQGGTGDYLEGISGITDTCQTIGTISGSYKHDDGKLTMMLKPGKLGLASNGHTQELSANPSKTGFVGVTAATGSGTAGQSMYAITSVTVTACP